MILLDARGLAAAYDGRTVFAGLDLQLEPGAYALQGRNGSGKSTLLRALAGAHRPASGTVSIAGHDLQRVPLAARRALSYVPDESPVYPFMSGAEFLHFVAAAKSTEPDETASALIDTLGLAPYLHNRFDALSLGTQKKLLLAAGWIGAPQVLLLDEPSNGLDAGARDLLAARIAADSTDKAILFATHDNEFIARTGADTLSFEELSGEPA